MTAQLLPRYIPVPLLSPPKLISQTSVYHHRLATTASVSVSISFRYVFVFGFISFCFSIDFLWMCISRGPSVRAIISEMLLVCLLFVTFTLNLTLVFDVFSTVFVNCWPCLSLFGIPWIRIWWIVWQLRNRIRFAAFAAIWKERVDFAMHSKLLIDFDYLLFRSFLYSIFKRGKTCCTIVQIKPFPIYFPNNFKWLNYHW